MNIAPGVSCPLCGQSGIQVYRPGGEGQLQHDSLGSSRTHVSHGTLLRCSDCSFVFSELRPADEDLHKLYREMDTTAYERESAGRQRTARVHLGIVQRYTRKGELLDVGCASGAFLHEAAESGWTVTGIEPAAVLCEKARGALGGRGRVLCSTLQGANLPPSSFDALTLWDVLEHVSDPVDFLTRCGALLRPNGFLFANVPDISTLPARILGDRWPLLLPEHLNYFDRASLRVCGDRAGLRWIAFGKRPTRFTLEYIFFRMSQHRIPGTSSGYRLLRKSRPGQICLPVHIGESYGVWQRV
ncbi:MAG: class I SAM-dependent methyltransferase [Acidobacteriaceae bacterium]